MQAVTISHNQTAPAFGVLLTIKQVAGFLGITPRTIYREIQRGTFPKPIHLTKRQTRWQMADIESHVAKLRASASSS